ncbi:MAG: sulfatase-like hydrolase/transferase, partial [Tunicatimonas sp.]
MKKVGSSVAIIVFFLSVGQVLAQPVTSAPTKPNIIVILADDMGYSDLGCTGSEINTPHLDQLATEGVLFTHCYNTSRCCPSRASLLTGLYQHRAGVGHMSQDRGHPSYQGHLNQQCVTIAEVLKEKGYRTIMSGKWH